MPRKHPREESNQVSGPPQLIPIDEEEQQLYFDLPQITELIIISSLRLEPGHQRRLILAALIRIFA